MTADAGFLTFGAILDRGERLRGDRVALIGDDRTVTYAEFNAGTKRLAAGLRDLGVGRGDRVAIVAENSVDLLTVLGATARLGAAFVPVNWRLTADEVGYLLGDAEPAVVFAATAHAGLVSAGRVFVLEDGLPSSSVGASDAVDDAVEDDLIALMYTAAMSGRPLGAMMTQRSFVYQSANIAAGLGFRATDVYANLLPLYHTAGLSYTLAFLQAGATIVLPSRFDAAATTALVAAHGVTVMAGTQPMGARILDVARETGADLRTLRLVLGREKPETMRDFASVAPDVHWVLGNYGQTETHGPAAVGEQRRGADLTGEIVARGWESPLTTVVIADEKDVPLPPGGVGQILVRGPSVAAGYWRSPDATARALRNGWWHTGDLGVRAEDGSIRFVARMEEKDFIKTGGENVYPVEVEAVLRRHPGVREVVVVGVADPQWREAVKAVVVPAGPVGDGFADELVELCRQHLASYKKPRTVQLVDALPTDARGAVDRAAAKKLFG